MSKAIVAGVDDELDRVARSCAALRAVHRADHYIEPDRSAPFELRVSVHTLGALRLMEIAGSPQSTRIGHGGEDVVLAIVVHAGHGRIRQGAREAVLGPGVLCLLHGGEAFELILNEGFRHQVVRVPRERMTESFPAWPVLLMCTIPTGRGPAAMLAAHLRATQEHLESLTPADQKGVSEALLCLLVSTLSASLPAPSERLSRIERYHLERVKAYVRAHLADPELNVATISAAMGLSVRYLHRLFAGESLRLMQWVAAARLEACHHELSLPENRKRAVSEIAYRWGFNNQAHFSRIFRARFGVSPTEVRDRQPARGDDVACRSGITCTDGANISALSRKSPSQAEC